MEYVLNRVNILLVALVGALCVYQWDGEKKADAQIEDLRRISRVDEDRIASQDLAVRGAREDIVELKNVISALKTRSDAGDVQVRQQKARIFTLEQREKRSAEEAEVWKKTLAAYKDAVAARDGNIRVLIGQRQQLIEAGRAAAKKATDAVVAYNDLAAKFEDLVGKYNDLAARYKAEHAAQADAQAKPSS